MVEINNLSSPQFVKAVQLWTGWRQDMMPNRNDNRVIEYFGEETSTKLLPLIKALANDFYSSDARLVAADLQEMEKLASEQFRQKYPTVPDEIVKAFAWCYTFDFK